MTQTEAYDVVIVGAGPAGTTCALALRERNLKVAVLDQARFPRDKVCGDAVPIHGLEVLRTLVPDLAGDLDGFHDKLAVRGARLVAPNGEAVVVPFGSAGYTSPRIDLDAYLFRQARARTDADFFENTPVDAVRVTDDYAEVVSAEAGRTFRAPLVIGCDGAHSAVARHLTGTKRDRRHHSGAVRAYYRGVAGVTPDLLEAYLLDGYLPGYFWIFPLPDDRVNVGFGMLSETISARRISLKHSLLEIIRTVPGIAERFRAAEPLGKVTGFGLPLGSRRVPIAGARFMLAGDAASLVDPATGDGIGNAMLSGMLAGRHALRCFEAGAFTAAFMQGYEEAVYGRLWPDLRRKYLIQRLVGDRAWLINFIVTRAARSPRFRTLVEKAV